MTAVLGPFLAFIPRFDPRAENLARSGSAYRWIIGSALVLLGAVQVFIVLAALGNELDVTRFVGVAVGILFVIIGNFLGKTRSSWFLGIRTPWTLSSDRSWTLTHRLGGYLFIATGSGERAGRVPLPGRGLLLGADDRRIRVRFSALRVFVPRLAGRSRPANAVR